MDTNERNRISRIGKVLLDRLSEHLVEADTTVFPPGSLADGMNFEVSASDERCEYDDESHEMVLTGKVTVRLFRREEDQDSVGG